MKTSITILLFLLISTASIYAQRNASLVAQAEKLIARIKTEENYPIGGKDTLIDLNGDQYKDILIEYYGPAGTGMKNRIWVFLFDPAHNSFTESEQLSNVGNPTFYFNQKMVTGYYIAMGGGYAVKLKWDHLKLDSLEYIDIEVLNTKPDDLAFRLSSYDYIAKKRKITTLSEMKLPDEYHYMDYIPLIKNYSH